MVGIVLDTEGLSVFWGGGLLAAQSRRLPQLGHAAARSVKAAVGCIREFNGYL